MYWLIQKETPLLAVAKADTEDQAIALVAMSNPADRQRGQTKMTVTPIAEPPKDFKVIEAAP